MGPQSTGKSMPFKYCFYLISHNFACQNSRNSLVCIHKSGCLYQLLFFCNLIWKKRQEIIVKKNKNKNLVLIYITPNLSSATIHYSSLPHCPVAIYISKHISISHCHELNKPGKTSAAFQPLAFMSFKFRGLTVN